MGSSAFFWAHWAIEPNSFTHKGYINVPMAIFLPSSRAKQKPEYLLCLLKSPVMRQCQFSMKDDKKRGCIYWAVKGQRVRFPVPGVLNLNPAYITCELKLEITKCTQTRNPGHVACKTVLENSSLATSSFDSIKDCDWTSSKIQTSYFLSLSPKLPSLFSIASLGSAVSS